MAERFEVRDIRAALRERLFPTVTVWNRLEGRPRTHDFDRALRAEVRDALWMLTRAVAARRVPRRRRRLAGLREAARDHDAASPVPARRRPGRAVRRRRRRSRRGRAAAAAARARRARGRARPAAGHGPPVAAADRRHRRPAARRSRTRTRSRCPTRRRPDDADRVRAPRGLAGVAAVAGRAMDGGAAVPAPARPHPANHAYDGVPGVARRPTRTRSTTAAERFVRWFERLLLPAAGGRGRRVGAGAPRVPLRRLRAATATARRCYVADEYTGGTLDWHSLDVDGRAPLDRRPAPDDRPAAGPPTQTHDPGAAGVRRDAEHALVGVRGPQRPTSATSTPRRPTWPSCCSSSSRWSTRNDWFLCPARCRRHPGDGAGPARSRTCSASGSGSSRPAPAPTTTGSAGACSRRRRGQRPPPADARCCCCRPSRRSHEGAPSRRSCWSATRWRTWSGASSARSRCRRREQAGHRGGARRPGPSRRAAAARRGRAPPPRPPPAAPIRYQVMSTVPENWIPFIPVHVDGPTARSSCSARRCRGSSTAIRDRREGAPAHRRCCAGPRPLAGAPYFVHEEEVPRTGVRVTQRWQRTRWRDGSVHVWLRRAQGPGPWRGVERAGVRPAPRRHVARRSFSNQWWAYGLSL